MGSNIFCNARHSSDGAFTAVVAALAFIVGCTAPRQDARCARVEQAASIDAVAVVSAGHLNQSINYGTFTDARDGKTYRTVVMPDGKTWMAENLNYDTADGTGSWCYDDDPKNCERYGRLYEWYTAREVCPAGWRLPSDDDWGKLINTVGGENIAGTKLKSPDGWYDGDSGYIPGTNAYGFSALPGGLRIYDSEDGWYSIGYNGVWWSATGEDASKSLDRGMGYDTERVGLGSSPRSIGQSVRCLRDD